MGGSKDKNHIKQTHNSKEAIMAAQEDSNKKVRKFNEVAMWRILALSIVMFAAGAVAMHCYENKLATDKQNAVHAAVSAATAKTPGK